MNLANHLDTSDNGSLRALSLTTLGHTLSNVAEFAEAEHHYRQALKLCEESIDPDCNVLVSVLNSPLRCSPIAMNLKKRKCITSAHWRS